MQSVFFEEDQKCKKINKKKACVFFVFFVFFEKNAKKNANPKLEKYKMQKKYKTKIPKIQNAKKYKSKIGKIQNTKNNTKNTKPTSCISQTLQF
jgi:hypothetical protein